MLEDTVHVCATLRNFESDADYLSFEDLGIQKLTEEDRKLFCKELHYFDNYPGDNYIAVGLYYIGRGKAFTVLQDNSRILFSPLFRALKLFKKGDLIMPLGFYKYKDKWHEKELHGESYGRGWDENLYCLKKEDIKIFETFRKEIKKYLEYIDFFGGPYFKKPEAFKDIDNRCSLAMHILLKGGWERWSPFINIDRLIDCTIALESLYLLRNDDKRDRLSARIAVILGKDKNEEEQIRSDIKKFYDIRSDIVHGSSIDGKDIKFLDTNIYSYEDILRRSILAFLDLNLRNTSKEVVLRTLDETIANSDRRQEIQESLKLLKLAK